MDVSGVDVSGVDVSGVDVSGVDVSNVEELDDEITLSDDDDDEGTIKSTSITDDNQSNSNSKVDEIDEDYESEDDDIEDGEVYDDETSDEEDNYTSKYKKSILNNSKHLEEINLDIENIDNDKIKLKNPKDVYFEIWRKSRTKAKKLKRQAIEAYLESKKIKVNYMISDIDNSDDELDTFIDKYVK